MNSIFDNDTYYIKAIIFKLQMNFLFSNLYKKLKKPDPPDLSPDEPPPDPHLPPKPIMRFYLLGWGVATIICGISAAVHLEQYAGKDFCFLAFGPSFAAFYVPVGILVFMFMICTLLIHCAIIANENEILINLTSGDILTNNLNTIPISQNLCNGRSQSKESVQSVADLEHSYRSQLHSHLLVLFFFIVAWTFAAFTTGRPFAFIIPYDNHIFAVLYCTFVISLVSFIFSFFCCSRNDIKNHWNGLCLKVKASSLHQVQGNGHPIEAPSDGAIELTPSVHESFDTSMVDSAHSKSNSRVSIGQVPNIKVYNQYPPVAAQFYNPKQSIMAKKFFEKNRRRQHLQILHNNLHKEALQVNNKDIKELKSNSSEVSHNIYKESLDKKSFAGLSDCSSYHIRMSDNKLNKANYCKCHTCTSSEHKCFNNLNSFPECAFLEGDSLPKIPDDKSCDNNQTASLSDSTRVAAASAVSHSCLSELTETTHQSSQHSQSRSRRKWRRSRRQRSRVRHHSSGSYESMPPSKQDGAKRGRNRRSSSHSGSSRRLGFNPYSSERSSHYSLNCHFPRSQSVYEQLAEVGQCNSSDSDLNHRDNKINVPNRKETCI